MYTQPEQQQSQEKYVVKKEDLESALASGNPEALEKFIEEARSAGQQEQTENMDLMEQAKATADPEIIEEAEDINKEIKKVTEKFKEAIEGEDFVMYLPGEAKQKKGEAEAAARERESKKLTEAKRTPEALAAHLLEKQMKKEKEEKEPLEKRIAARRKKFQRPNASL
jgi:hypothetical protein